MLHYGFQTPEEIPGGDDRVGLVLDEISSEVLLAATPAVSKVAARGPAKDLQADGDGRRQHGQHYEPQVAAALQGDTNHNRAEQPTDRTDGTNNTTELVIDVLDKND